MHPQITIHGVFAAVAIALTLTLQLSAGETIVDDARGFTLTLPDGFAPNPDLVGAAPDIVHGFVLGDPTDHDLDIVLFIDKMRGTIGRERLKPEDMPPGFQGRLFTTQGQEFDVDALRDKTFVWAVVLPLPIDGAPAGFQQIKVGDRYHRTWRGTRSRGSPD